VAHQNVLLERMEKQFSVFGEGQILLTEKVDRLEERMEKGFHTIDERMGKFEEGQNLLAEKVETLDQKLDRIHLELKSEIGEVKARVGQVEERNA